MFCGRGLGGKGACVQFLPRTEHCCRSQPLFSWARWHFLDSYASSDEALRKPKSYFPLPHISPKENLPQNRPKLLSKARHWMAQLSLPRDGEGKQQMMIVSCIALGTAGKFLTLQKWACYTTKTCYFTSLILYRDRPGVTFLFGCWGPVWGTTCISEQMRWQRWVTKNNADLAFPANVSLF